jgi:aldehyde:ferredoxin oxidoreductase
MAGVMSEGIDGEAMAWMTCHVGGESKDVAAYGYSLMNRYGLDTQEMGSVIGLFMLLYERGVITDETVRKLKGGWLRPDWGNPETILSLVDMVAFRQGIGNLMAEGPYLFAKNLGGDAERHVLQNKGLSMGGGDRRPQRGAILNHMVSSRGPDHLRGSPSLEFYGYTGDQSIQVDWDKYVGEPELFKYAVQLLQYHGKAPLVIFQEHLRTLSDSFGVCSFNYGNWPNTRIYPADFAGLFTAATGFESSGEEMTLAAKRIHNMEKAFNIREGWEREDDQPPDRWTKEKKEAGIYKGEYCDLEKFNRMLSEYYHRRGWNKDSGLLTRECLEETGLKDVADDLERSGKLDASSGPWKQPPIPASERLGEDAKPAKEAEYFGD